MNQDNPENNISVVKVFASAGTAEAEAKRLSGINKDKGCSYVVFTSRLVP